MSVYYGNKLVAGGASGGGGGTTACNYNYSQLSGTVEDIVEGNNTAIGSIMETKLTTNNTAIGTVVEGKLTTNNTTIGTVVENKLTANNPTIQRYVTGNNDVLSSMISSIVEKAVQEKISDQYFYSGEYLIRIANAVSAEGYNSGSYVNARKPNYYSMETIIGLNAQSEYFFECEFMCCPYITTIGPYAIGYRYLKCYGRCSNTDYNTKTLYLDCSGTLTFEGSGKEIFVDANHVAFPNVTTISESFSGGGYDGPWIVVRGNGVKTIDLRSLTSFTSTTNSQIISKCLESVDVRSITKSQFKNTFANKIAQTYETGVVAKCSDGYLKYSGSSWINV